MPYSDNYKIRPLTNEEMVADETEKARILRIYLEGYIDCPTEDVFAEVSKRMKDFQAAWMNGRKRALP